MSLFWTGNLAVVMLAVTLAPPPLAPSLPLIAHIAGLLAGYTIVALMLLMARTPLLEHTIGADRMARWHGRLGRWTIVVILIHAVAATLGWAQAQTLSIPVAAGQVLQMPGLFAATASTVMLLAIGILSARAARRRVSYETWHAIHLGTYLAITLAFAHELAGPDLAGRPAIQIAWSLAYTLSFALIIRYRVIAPLIQAARHRMRVEDVIDEGDGVVSIVVRGDDLSSLNAQSGQFFRWRFLTMKTWSAGHPFSLSSPPTAGTLRLTVKAVGAGTRALHELKVGTRVIAEGPYGAMTGRRRTRRGVLLIAGGVGITPMRTLFETLPRANGPLTLIYRTPSLDLAIFRTELEAIAERREAQVIYWTGRSSEPQNAITAANLLARVPDLAERDVYMCAGPALTRATTAALLDAGLPSRHLHVEEFTF